MPDITVKDLIRQEAQKQGVPVSLALAVAEHESGPDFNPFAKGKEIQPGVYAYGTMQLLPDTAKMLGVNRDDPTENVRGGVKYLRQLLDQHQGDLTKVLSAYGGDSSGTGLRYGVPRILELRNKYANEDFDVAAAEKQAIERYQVNQPRADPFKGSGPGTKLTGPPTWGERARQAGRAVVEELPMLGAAGAAAASVAAVPVTGGVSLAAPLIAAYLGGSLGGAARQKIQESGLVKRPSGEPPRPGSLGGAMHQAGTEQTLYEAGGQIPVRVAQFAGRRFVGSRAARFAKEGVSKAEEAFHATLTQTLDTAEKAVEGLRRGRAIANRAVGGRVRSLQAGAREGTAAAQAALGSAAQRKIQGDLEAKQIAGVWPTSPLGGPPPAPSQVGREAAAVIQGPRSAPGPAKRYIDELGEGVGAAAESGPVINPTNLKQEAQRIVDEELGGLKHFQKPPEAEVDPALAALGGYGSVSQGASPEQAARVKAALKAQGIDLTPPAPEEVVKHPAMQVIQKFLNEHPEGEVPFSAWHELKRNLYEAVNFESPAKKQVQQITKKLSLMLRDELHAAHPEYAAADAAYSAAIKLRTKGIAPRLLKSALDNPESLVDLVKANQPTRFRMLKEVLLEHAAQGGDAAMGRQAYDNLLEAWVHKHLVQPGIEKFPEKLAKMDPEFVEAAFGDAKWGGVLGNLRTISDALIEANTRAGAEIAALKGSARAATTAARQDTRQAAEWAARRGEMQDRVAARLTEKQAALAETRREVIAKKQAGLPEARALAGSSLARVGTSAQSGTDIAHLAAGGVEALARGGGPSYWVLASGFRLATRGAKISDLVRFAKYSPFWTRQIVKASTSSAPGAALADVWRAITLAQEIQGAGGQTEPAASHTPSGPPPAPTPRR